MAFMDSHEVRGGQSFPKAIRLALEGCDARILGEDFPNQASAGKVPLPVDEVFQEALLLARQHQGCGIGRAGSEPCPEEAPLLVGPGLPQGLGGGFGLFGLAGQVPDAGILPAAGESRHQEGCPQDAPGSAGPFRSCVG